MTLPTLTLEPVKSLDAVMRDAAAIRRACMKSPRYLDRLCSAMDGKHYPSLVRRSLEDNPGKALRLELAEKMIQAAVVVQNREGVTP